MLRRIRGKYFFITMFIILVILFFIVDKNVDAKGIADEMEGNLEYDEVQYVIDELLNENNEFNFGKFVDELIRGENKLSFTEILIAIKDGILAEIKGNIGKLVTVVSIAIIAAVFTNISYAFKDNQVADAGFYIAYLLLFSVATTSFIAVSGIATEAIHSILDFMKVLIPTYILAIAFSTGSVTSYAYYQLTLFLISFIDLILLKVIIPMINIYFIITITNNLSKRDMLSKLSNLLSDGVSWILKSLLAVVIGLNAIQGLISPVADKIKQNGILRLAKAVPGAGEIIGGVAESVIGAGVLLKNATGVAGVVVIIIICAVPLLKLGVTTVVYKVSSVIVQPISDKRLINCISGAASASGLLLKTVIVGLVLFIITLTIVAVSTT